VLSVSKINQERQLKLTELLIKLRILKAYEAASFGADCLQKSLDRLELIEPGARA
jgi:hypothetical protein